MIILQLDRAIAQAEQQVTITSKRR